MKRGKSPRPRLVRKVKPSPSACHDREQAEEEDARTPWFVLLLVGV